MSVFCKVVGVLGVLGSLTLFSFCKPVNDKSKSSATLESRLPVTGSTPVINAALTKQLDDLTELRASLDATAFQVLGKYADWPSRYSEFIIALRQGDPIDAPAAAWNDVPRTVTETGDSAMRLRTEGLSLSAVNCSACHLRPEPAALTKAAWALLFRQKLDLFAGSGVLNRNAMPAEKADFAMPRATFGAIVYAYMMAAPEYSIPQVGKPEVNSVEAPFRLKYSAPLSPSHRAMYSAVSIDAQRREIYLGSHEQIEVVTAEGGLVARYKVIGTPTQVLLHNKALFVTSIGEDVYPSPRSEGRVTQCRIDSNSSWPKECSFDLLFDNLYRPVRVNFGDLNVDGVEDALIPEFGIRVGRMSWYPGKKAGGYAEPKRLFDEPGFLEAEVSDVNHDGRADVVLLQAQEQERILLALNEGKARFKFLEVERKPPEFGYNSLAMFDVDGDGFQDIITTNGDNFDLYIPPLRNYHGVRVLKNKGTNRYKESYFYPMYGAMQAEAADYDLDGDTDIVAISYWPATRKPEGFVYLENRGNLRFVPHHLSVAGGAWIAMAKGDWDVDGDLDLALVAMEPYRNDRPGFVLLENTTRRQKENF